MPDYPSRTPAAFRALRARLLARRAAEMGPRLWLVTLALAACIGAFTYWQVRVPLDGALRHGGASGATLRLGVTLALGVLGAGVIAHARQVTLASAPPGPEWLALPVEPRWVEQHLAREAALPALTVIVPMAAAWIAGLGLLSPLTLLALAVASALAFALVTRLACALALRAPGPMLRMGAPTHAPSRRLPAAWRALVSARRPVHTARQATPRFRTEPRWRALSRLDRAVSLRAGSPRARLAFTALALVSSVVAWFVGADPREERAQAFAGFSLACAMLGAWAAWRAAADPPSAVRPLPLTLADAWLARALPMFALLGATLVLHATVPAVPWFARLGLALSWTLPALLVPLFGLHLGLSLAGKPLAAENLYYGWLGAGLIASLAIPLFGWAILGAGFIHATRRVTRWNTPEVA
jgi:hypothetical protein